MEIYSFKGVWGNTDVGVAPEQGLVGGGDQPPSITILMWRDFYPKYNYKVQYYCSVRKINIYLKIDLKL